MSSGAATTNFKAPIIIGGGLAGMAAALELSPMPCILITAAKTGEGGSTAWAQGGLAAAVGDDDTPELHAEDTIKAGAGLCDPETVRSITAAGPGIIDWLIAHSVAFDRDNAGKLRLGLEAAHNRRRIVHAAGDSTGAMIAAALARAVASTPSITVLDQAYVTGLLTDDHGVAGVAINRHGKSETIQSCQIVLATGGAGALWGHTTNPLTSWGRGLALAARAGAIMADLEFMQFHPTAIAIAPPQTRLPSSLSLTPLPLASEALRGEGAWLVDETGSRFMADYPRAELEPRDVVARAIWKHLGQNHTVYLDTRATIAATFPERFPNIYALCAKAGIDPVREPIPVRPAAHYHMGGVKTDQQGRTSVSGLWACGEVAATGLHGANRLASNSLLEAGIMGRRVAADIKNGARQNQSSSLRDMAAPFQNGDDDKTSMHVRSIMAHNVGLLRDRMGLENACAQLTPLARTSDRALVALMIATAALQRRESRGAHARLDFPDTNSSLAQSQNLSLADLPPALHTENTVAGERHVHIA